MTHVLALPIAWLVLAVNAAFVLHLGLRARGRHAPEQAAADPAGPEIELSPALKTVLEAAERDVRARGHRRHTLEHLLLAMTHDEECVGILRGCGADPADLARELDEYLALVTLNEASMNLEQVLRVAAIRTVQAGRAQIDARTVLIEICRRPDTYAALLVRAAGVEVLDVLRFVSHGAVDIRPSAVSSERAGLRLHNDDYTTQAFVVVLLRGSFGLPEADAEARMMQIHREGSAVLDTLPADEALDRARHVHEQAERAGFPLRCSLEPA